MKNIQLEELKEFMDVENYGQRTIQIYLNSLSSVPNFPVHTTKRELHEHIKRMLINSKLSHNDSDYKNMRAAVNLWFRMKTGTKIKEYEKTLKPPSQFDDLLQSFYNYSVTIKQILAETAVSECSHVRNFLEFAFNKDDEIIFTEISALTIRDYVCAKIATLSDSSKGRYVTSIRNFFRFLKYSEVSVHPSVFKIPLSPVA